MPKRLAAEHAVVCDFPDEVTFGYFAWPTVIRLSERDLMIGASGFRTRHIDPFGRTALFESHDGGRSWGAPAVINDSPIDDRDVGLLKLRDGRILMTWFREDTRKEFDPVKHPERSLTRRLDLRPVLSSWEDDIVRRYEGSWLRIRGADGVWGKELAIGVSAPHGPIQLADGTIFYVGRRMPRGGELPRVDGVAALVSRDGEHWEERGELPDPPDAEHGSFFCEPHALELPDGRIIVHLRREKEFATWQCVSADGGYTWSEPEFLCSGAPSHLLRHSSGVIVATYGYRKPGFGQRVLLSRDDGRSYESWILRDDGFDPDLGYPSTVELADGSLYTVCYQRARPGAQNCALLSSRWELPY